MAIERNLANLTELLQTITRVSQTHQAERSSDPGIQTISLSMIAKDVARELRHMAAARHVEMRVHPELPWIKVDVGQLELILTNLLSNEIKYSDSSKTTRFVEVVPLQVETGCGFQVRDNGVGMTADQLRDAFVAFYRARDEASSEGLGLGLTIVRDCAEAMGASVTADAIIGEGSTFTVAFPAPDCADR